jgi:large subunit ribosomal protein L9
MKVILSQTVPGLGEKGAIRDVADGYARNYLIPKGLALAATNENIKLEQDRATAMARREARAREELSKRAAVLEGKTVVIRARVGPENRLYGSVTPSDVAEALHAQLGVSIDRRHIELAEPVHRVGTYAATANLGRGVEVKFNIEVMPEVPGASGKPGRAGKTAGKASTGIDTAGASDRREDTVEGEGEGQNQSEGKAE